MRLDYHPGLASSAPSALDRSSWLSGKSRNTQQRRAITEAFLESARPLTVPEVHELARSSCERLGVATVYRAVNKLKDEGWLSEVRLPDQPARYERHALAHHHHFHCELCGRVWDTVVPCESLAQSVPEGFQVSRHEVTFYGACAECTGSL